MNMDMVQTEFAIRRLAPEEPRNRSLLELVDLFSRGKLVPPFHQRKSRWPDEKRIDYIRRCRGPKRPPGSFETYQLTSDPNLTMYLNDGNNRMRALQWYLEHTGQFGDTADFARDEILGPQVASVNHSHYISHPDAYVDFVLVNMGTGMSAYEQCRGVLLYANGEERAPEYLEFIEGLHRICEIYTQELVKADHRKGDYELKLKRHDFVLLTRYLARDRSLSNYGLSFRPLTAGQFQRQESTVEGRLKPFIVGKNIDDLAALTSAFGDLLGREVATIRRAWDEMEDRPRDKGVCHSAARWLMEVGIWRHNTQQSVDRWLDFLSRFFAATMGGNLVRQPDNVRSYKTTSLGDLTKLAPIATWLDSSLVSEMKNRKSQNRMGVGRGYDVSHIEPFSLCGEGPTVIEPSSINRARGAQPIQAP